MKKILLIIISISFCFFSFADEELFWGLDGDPVRYSQLVSSPKTVIFTWAIWCPYCRRALEGFSRNCKSFEGIDVIYLNLGDSEAKIKKYTRQRKIKDCIKKKIILDEQSLMARKFSLMGLPSYIFFKDGKFLAKSFYLDDELIKNIFEDG